MMMLDGTCYKKRFGDPSSWSGDWRRPGNYLRGGLQDVVHSKLEANRGMLVGMAIRRVKSKIIAAVFGVSRESVDRRLRPLGLKNQPGHVGRPGGCSVFSPRRTMRRQYVCPMQLWFDLPI